MKKDEVKQIIVELEDGTREVFDNGILSVMLPGGKEESTHGVCFTKVKADDIKYQIKSLKKIVSKLEKYEKELEEEEITDFENFLKELLKATEEIKSKL